MDRKFEICREQALALHEGQPLVALNSLGGATCAMLILLNTDLLPHSYLIAWFLVFALHTLLSFRHRSRINRDSLSDMARLDRWFRWSVINMGSLGVLWSLLFVPALHYGDTAYQLAVLAGAAMLGAEAVASLGSHLPTYRAHFLMMLPPITLTLLTQGQWLNLGMGLASILFIAFMLWSGNRFNTSYIESLRLRFENLDLMRELTLQKEAAESAALAKSRFLAAASHDLRQPMYALNLYHGALEQCELDRDARVALSNARQCALAMDGMFAVLLDMSKLDAGSVEPVIRAFPVSEMLERIRVEFAPTALEKGLEFRVASCSAVIRSDVALAERIVRNFVANALRYTTSGGVLVGCRRHDDRLRVTVVDTGRGIPEDKLQAVFEEYVQLGNQERDRNKGLGLGLAIVQRLSILLKAPVAVRSWVGRGSSFSVDFPRAVLSEVEPAAVQTPRTGNLGGRLVAVIDDEAMIRDAVKTVLERWGCSVVVAGSGDEAVSLLAMSPKVPDVVLCDYRLREGETGLEAIEKLRAEFCADIPALLVTGDTAPERIQEIRESGLLVLHKPLQPHTLRATLQACLADGGTQPAA